MSDPKKCPNCEEEMDELFAELGICSECGEMFDESDLKSEDEDSEDDDESDEDEEDDA